jgi:FOG: EAL domain
MEFLVMLDCDDIVPYFQPIFFCDTPGVYGYEVLGRMIRNGRPMSLGPVFEGNDFTDEQKLRLDFFIRNMAIRRYLEAGCPAKLFLNIHPNWRDSTNPSLPLRSLRAIRASSIEPGKIVIEITEGLLREANHSFFSALEEYRSAGCKIAVDDFGSLYSNFGRVAAIRPDILKVDRSLVLAMEKNPYSAEVCLAIAQFAETLGCEILYEGVETEEQLLRSIQLKGQYVQGFLLANPAPDFTVSLDVAGALVAKNIEKNLAQMLSEAAFFRTVTRNLEDRINEWQSYSTIGIAEILLELPAYCCCIYICDRKGRFLSYVYRRNEKNEVRTIQFPKGTLVNRSFFNDAMRLLDKTNKTVLSRPYRDIFSRENIVTLCYYLHTGDILSVDILFNQALLPTHTEAEEL